MYINYLSLQKNQIKGRLIFSYICAKGVEKSLKHLVLASLPPMAGFGRMSEMVRQSFSEVNMGGSYMHRNGGWREGARENAYSG